MSKFPGGHRGRVTPVPIPNTEVKPATADGTACEGAWESRSLPGLFYQRLEDQPLGPFPLYARSFRGSPQGFAQARTRSARYAKNGFDDSRMNVSAPAMSTARSPRGLSRPSRSNPLPSSIGSDPYNG